jgi:penicillin-binding protein 1C
LTLRWVLRALVIAAAVVALPILGLAVAAMLTPLPAELLGAEPPTSLRVLDREGRPLAVVRASDGALGASVTLAEVAPEFSLALIAAEDARFYRHLGIDPLALARATGQLLWHRRVVSGASTLSQQLARNVSNAPRTLWGKLAVTALALRIELGFTKSQILEQYVNRIEFGPNVRGVEAASRFFFDKPARTLGLAESATLAAMARGPSLYDPRRSANRTLSRRNRVLARMAALGMVTRASAARAIEQPLRIQPTTRDALARHLVRALATGRLEPWLKNSGALRSITTTLDRGLQAEAQDLVHRQVLALGRYDVSAAAAVVLDNASGQVLAYVGSGDFFDTRALGQNDGVLALRQPGSALKPFVYAAAMQSLGWTPATIVPDLEVQLDTPEGTYSPRNYDGRFHGPVRLREALGSSLNVPAVIAAQRVGPSRVLEMLRAFGFTSLGRSAAHYGAALALGDGEVTLLELCQAYATLARGGLTLPVRMVTEAAARQGAVVAPGEPEPSRVLDARLAALLTNILADDEARAAEFGRDSVLVLRFPMAAKTGTSKGFRDNWAVGYTHEVTVGVWVGNFDGRPMLGSSGVTGAGPLLHRLMLAAMRGRSAAALFTPGDVGLVSARICAESGELAASDCPHPMVEWFLPERRPRQNCALHIRTRIDPENGLRAGPACASAEERVLEHYPEQYRAWAHEVGRPVVPDGSSPRCPDETAAATSPVIEFPRDGARFTLDPALPAEQQELVLRARVPGGVSRVTWQVDGRSVGSPPSPFELLWPVEKGRHRIVVVAGGRQSEAVVIDVE